MESGMDFDREVSEALEYQARTTALLTPKRFLSENPDFATSRRDAR